MPSPAFLDRPWYVTAFGPLYRRVYAHRGEEEARRHAPAIRALLALPRNSRVLDLACGEGRYTRALTLQGYRMTGVDLSAEMLASAARASADLPGTPTWFRGDMRELPFFEQFEGAVSLFTSFGYFDDRVEDLRQLRAVHRALVPGGRFLIDVANAVGLKDRLIASSEERRHPFLFRSRRAWDEETPHGPYVRKETEVVDLRTGATVKTISERVRPYGPDALDDALRAAGLEPAGARRGDLDGRGWSPDAPRLVRLAQRPGGRTLVPLGALAEEAESGAGRSHPVVAA
jgi:SAM-dependent methyltransferase